MSKPVLKTKTRLAVSELLDRVLSGIAPRHSVASSRALDLSELEERILLSASPVMAVAEMADAALADSMTADVATSEALTPATPLQFSSDEQSDSGVSTTASQTATRELVFLDTSVEDYQTLLNDLWAADDPGRDIEVILLSNSRDGIDQISETLAGRSDIDSVHFVTHGTDRAVKLGATWLTNDNLAGYVGEMARWGDALAIDADLLFYGCNLAGSDAGLTLLESVQTLTSPPAPTTPEPPFWEATGSWSLNSVRSNRRSSSVRPCRPSGVACSTRSP